VDPLVPRRQSPRQGSGPTDGYTGVFVKAEVGYQGTTHRHDHAEFLYLVDGQIQNQGHNSTAVTAMPRYRIDA